MKKRKCHQHPDIRNQAERAKNDFSRVRATQIYLVYMFYDSNRIFSTGVVQTLQYICTISYVLCNNIVIGLQSTRNRARAVQFYTGTIMQLRV